MWKEEGIRDKELGGVLMTFMKTIGLLFAVPLVVRDSLGCVSVRYPLIPLDSLTLNHGQLTLWLSKILLHNSNALKVVIIDVFCPCYDIGALIYRL